MRATAVVSVAVGAMVLIGCRSASTIAPLSHFQAGSVPPVAPNNIPQALFDSLGLVQQSNGHGSPWRRSMVSVMFNQNATRAEREAAVRSIDGRVVGGFRWLDGDGDYFVRIPGTTFHSIAVALETLRALPQVSDASPLIIDSLSRAALRRP